MSDEQYKTAAQHRDTPLHLISFRVAVEGIYVTCAVRYEPPDIVADPEAPNGTRLQAKRIPELLVRFDELDDAQNALFRSTSIALESIVADRVVAYQTSPERQATKVTEALEAEARARTAKEEAERIEAANREAEKRAAEAQQVALALAAEVESHRAEIASLRAERAELASAKSEAALEAKQADAGEGTVEGPPHKASV